MGRAGVRAEWSAIPELIRDRIDELAGASVRRATNLEGGFSPGPAARCELADGRTVFVKAGGADLNAITPHIHRREAAILDALPRPYPAPELIGVVDDGDWVALVIEWVPGRMPTAPLTSEDVDAVMLFVHELADAGRGCRPEGVEPLTPDARIDAAPSQWAAIADDGTIDHLDPWSRRHIETLVESEAGAMAAAQGDTLVHLDLRTDNILLPERGGTAAVAVDWSSAAIAAPFVDLVASLPALHIDGSPPPWEVFGRQPLGRAADADAVTAFLVFLAGYFTRQSLLPPPLGLPTVRAFQAAQGVVARDWLARRLRLS